MEKIYLAAEAAEILRVKEAKIMRLARTGKLGYLKDGNGYTFPESVLEAYVARYTTVGVPNPHGLTDAAVENINNGRATRGRRTT